MSEETTAPAAAEFEVPAKFKTLVDSVEKLTVLELHELVKVLEEKFGVSAAAVAMAPAGGAGAGEAAEEKSSFNVYLADAGAAKVQVIKAIKDALNLGLKEAKDLVDAAPGVIKEGAKKEEADALKAAIETAGGKVVLK